MHWNSESRDEYIRLRPKDYYFKRFIIGSLLLLIIQVFDDEIIVLFIGIGVGLYLLMVYLNFHSGMWLAIQDEYVRTNPSKAAWFLIIPLFNLYWYFVVYPRFVKDHNRYLKRYSLKASDLPFFLFLLFAILNLFGSLPFFYLLGILTWLGVNFGRYFDYLVYLGIACGIIKTILFFVIVSKVCDAVGALTIAKTQRKAEEMHSYVHVPKEIGGIVIDE